MGTVSRLGCAQGRTCAHTVVTVSGKSRILAVEKTGEQIRACVSRSLDDEGRRSVQHVLVNDLDRELATMVREHSERTSSVSIVDGWRMVALPHGWRERKLGQGITNGESGEHATAREVLESEL